MKLDWNEGVPINIETGWTKIEKNIARLHTVSTQVNKRPSAQVVTHGLSNASERAYGYGLHTNSTRDFD